MEVWTHRTAAPRAIAREAALAQESGWDGLCVVDSQNLSGDPYVALTMAATATSSIGLGIAVTNSVTRTAAATATAIASVDRVSNGRAVLGIGRGDSALAHLGRAPAPLAQFEQYLKNLDRFLRGETVPFDEIDLSVEAAPPLAQLDLAGAPKESQIGWLKGARKVPVEVAASGPRAIAVAACNAERVMLALGADPERLAWGIKIGRTAREAAGLDPNGVEFGAYLNCVCHPDIAAARELVKGGLTTFARFSVMHGKVSGPITADMQKAIETMRAAYDMRKHTRADSDQAATLTPEFIDYFAVVGPPERCLERLSPLASLGISKIFFAANFEILKSDAGKTAVSLLENEVIPTLKNV